MNLIEHMINHAIINRKIIHFIYDGYVRQVEPHHYGILNQSMQLHGYQISNGSKSGELPEWRNFKFDHIQNLSINDHTFERRPDHHPFNSNYSKIIKTV
ncbi:WYL domain-containing protein [Legionella oakridgensis]|uniref:Uncharacterized protein n=2 Tax=Legionella oakridgensis TaxID=29423 RepID=W0BEW4_9GAMM|nr:WYL domain-containing protein [Legionella oakridgensis]AHE68400.1 hypothetical protein Loa_02872 [Legionella oakridgensis ATCC 33761 = DSM 21215]ETO92146.1 WYL domain protein [Legionella oakridgensis RV-2-2007]KTD38443.1 hypothetical protein Loak_1388 [Legionella oakridgensis]STY21340.1 Uncharacterised protein [Legionella longbeachae]